MADITLFATIFTLGLTASFYPCLFPIFPSFVAYLVESHENWWKGMIGSVLVTFGIMTVFTGLGLVFTALISTLGAYYAHFRLLQGILLLILGVLLIANVSVTFMQLHSANAAANRFLDKLSNKWILAYFIGLFFAVLAAPCAIIVFFTVFTLVATETTFSVILLMIAFSVGAGIPFFLMGAIVPALKDSVQLDYNKIRNLMPRIAGILVILIGVYLIGDALFILL